MRARALHQRDYEFKSVRATNARTHCSSVYVCVCTYNVYVHMKCVRVRTRTPRHASRHRHSSTSK